MFSVTKKVKEEQKVNMKNNKNEIKDEITNLLKDGLQILVNETEIKVVGVDIKKQKSHESLSGAYNSWYSKCLPVIKTILPDRYADFIEYYKNSKPRKEISYENYTISDYLISMVVSSWGEEKFSSKTAFTLKLNNQISILKSALDRVDFALSNIEGLLQADLFDGELSASRELFTKKHLRAGGVLAGVVLEKHLKNVTDTHKISIAKKKPTLSDFNDTLKDKGVYDVPTWRQIQRLADIRNLCAHGNERDPTKEEVEEMINGVEKVIKNIF
ncbi:MAG: hypothetical protein U0Y10_07235 [Spirosomataceae bacterium]